MSDACIVCECEAVDTEEWYYNAKSTEFTCPWCVKDMWKIKDLIKPHNRSDFHARQLFDEIENLLEIIALKEEVCCKEIGNE